MQSVNDDRGHAQLSVGWLGGGPDPGDATLERAAAYAAVLARLLSTAGYQPRRLAIGVRRESRDLLRLSVRGEIPGISRPDFENLARETLNGVGARLGFSADNDLVLIADLEPQVSVTVPAAPAPLPATATPVDLEPLPPAAPPRVEKRSYLERLPLGRLAIGLALGLLLGVLGLPRLELSLPGLPSPEPTIAPTPVIPQVLAVQRVPTEPPPPPRPTAVPPTPTAPPATPTPIAPHPLFAERFTNPILAWPNDPGATAWFEEGEYRLYARDPGQFVAIGVPVVELVQNAQLTAQFHKVDGPGGGGYGLIVRDQGSPGERDGRNQGGEYLVFEVNDRGEFGVWQRDQTRWIDVVPWTNADAVHPDRDSNVLSVITRGNTLRLQVNGQVIADLGYDQLPAVGGVGIFAGGDLNEVALEWLRIESL